MTVAKIIACILIVSHIINSSVAAPLADNSMQQPTQPQSGSEEKQNRKNSEQRKSRFTKQDAEMWRNPCNADSMINESSISLVDPSASYANIKMVVTDIDLELRASDIININNYHAWDKFNADKYDFLPVFPGGNHRQWHWDMQKYVASFILLQKNQKIDDELHNNNTMSQELGRILQDARKMLCEIEHFVNATSSKKIGSDDWITKKQMHGIIKFQNLTAMFLHRTYAKGRFQDYIHKLLRRIEHQSSTNFVEKKVSYPKFKLLRKNRKQTTKKARRGNKRIQNERRQQQQNESTPTKRVHIVRTTKQPSQTRIVKNKNNRRRMRTKTTTTIAPSSTAVA